MADDGMSFEEFLDAVRRVEKAYGQHQRTARLAKQPPNPLKHRQPRVTRMASPRQRLAEGQTDNEVRAAYHLDSRPTPVRSSEEGLTRNVGASDIPLNEFPTGKATNSREPDKEETES